MLLERSSPQALLVATSRANPPALLKSVSTMQRTHSLMLSTSGHDDVHVEPLRGEELHAYIPLRLACLKRVVDTRHMVAFKRVLDALVSTHAPIRLGLFLDPTTRSFWETVQIFLASPILSNRPSALGFEHETTGAPKFPDMCSLSCLTEL